MRSPVTEVINRYNALTDEQQKLFLDFVAPEPEPETPRVKRTRKKKAEAPAAQKRGLPGTATEKAKDAPAGECIKPVGDTGLICGLPYDNPLHHDSVYTDFHEFEAPKVKKASGK